MQAVSYRAICSEAWGRTRQLLFRPFNLTIWMVVGFGAWLAALGEQGGSFGFNWPFSSDQNMDPREMTERVLQFIVDHVLLVTVTVSAALLILALVTTVMLWLSSRGKCLFVEQVVSENPTVQEAWGNQRAHGYSVFLWRIAYLTIVSLLLMCLFGAGVFLVLPCFLEGALLPTPLLLLVLLGFVVLLVLLLMAVVSTFLNDFVIPIMLLRDETAVRAWHTLLRLFYSRVWVFVAYCFVKTGLVLLFGVAFLTVFFLTCCLFCVGGVLLAIPYIGTVVLLPYHVFLRYFSLAFLASMGPEWDLLHTPDSPDEEIGRADEITP